MYQRTYSRHVSKGRIKGMYPRILLKNVSKDVFKECIKGRIQGMYQRTYYRNVCKNIIKGMYQRTYLRNVSKDVFKECIKGRI